MFVAIWPARQWFVLAQGGPNPCGGLVEMLPAFLGIFVLFYFLFVRPQARERQRREVLLREIKRNDRVVTIGGIIGTVSNVSADSNEVTLKIDESNNTKMRVLRTSIHEVLRDDDTEDKQSSR